MASKLDILELPEKREFYLGEIISLQGMLLVETDENGNEKVFTVEECKLYIFGDLETVGKKKIHIYREDKYDPVVLEIEIKEAPKKSLISPAALCTPLCRTNLSIGGGCSSCTTSNGLVCSNGCSTSTSCAGVCYDSGTSCEYTCSSSGTSCAGVCYDSGTSCEYTCSSSGTSCQTCPSSGYSSLVRDCAVVFKDKKGKVYIQSDKNIKIYREIKNGTTKNYAVGNIVYVNNNQGVNNSTAVAKTKTFTLNEDRQVVCNLFCYAEFADKLTIEIYNADDETLKTTRTYRGTQTSKITFSFTLQKGNYYMKVKFIKDGSVHAYDDSCFIFNLGLSTTTAVSSIYENLLLEPIEGEEYSFDILIKDV